MKRHSAENKIYVSQSEIPKAERGVFANVDIAKGEAIEICPIIEIDSQDLENLERSILINYFYFFGKDKERMLIALGFGSIYNHSYVPNALYKIKPEEETIEFMALREIKKDEEIVVNYNQDSKGSAPLWFED